MSDGIDYQQSDGEAPDVSGHATTAQPSCKRCYGSRFIQVTRYCGTHAEVSHVECSCQGPPMRVATIRTRHPENYLLVNEHDGSRWRLDRYGVWKRDDRAAADRGDQP